MKRLVILFTVFVSLVMGGVSSLGTVANAQIKHFIITDTTSGISDTVDNINSEIQRIADGFEPIGDAWKFVSFDEGDKHFSVDREYFLNLNPTFKREIMRLSLNIVKESPIAERDRGRIYQFIAKQDEGTSKVLKALGEDLTVEINWAMRFLDFYRSPINNLIGVLVILICSFLMLSLAIDILVMNTPPLMLFLHNKYQTRPAFISPEAWYSYRDAISSPTYKQYLGTYLMRKLPLLLVTGLCLSYIIVGNITSFAVFLADVFRPS